jgi:hypothetical protein
MGGICPRSLCRLVFIVMLSPGVGYAESVSMQYNQEIPREKKEISSTILNGIN